MPARKNPRLDMFFFALIFQFLNRLQFHNVHTRQPYSLHRDKPGLSDKREVGVRVTQKPHRAEKRWEDASFWTVEGECLSAQVLRVR